MFLKHAVKKTMKASQCQLTVFSISMRVFHLIYVVFRNNGWQFEVTTQNEAKNN